MTQTGRQSQRIRRLPATAVVWLAIAIGIGTDLDIPAVWRQVVGALRSLFSALDAKHPPCKSALSQARTRLGPGAMRQLFVATSAPIALDRTRGAFYKAMRQMVVLYHQRWEIEIGNDEVKTHQLHRQVHLRSRTPCGILQEMYGLLPAYP